MVISDAADAVGMADGNHDFKFKFSSLGDNFIKFGLAFRTQHRLVEVEQRVSGNCHFFTESSRLLRYGLRSSRFANFSRNQIFVTFTTILVLCSSCRCPVAGAPALTIIVENHFAALVNNVNAGEIFRGLSLGE